MVAHIERYGRAQIGRTFQPDAFGERRQLLGELARLPGEERHGREEWVAPHAQRGGQARCGRCAAKCAACWPVPLPTSSTLWLAANSVLRTSRIGPLLRSQASDSVSTARVCDNAPMPALDGLL